MPRTHNNTKQKNKPFKGSRKGAKKAGRTNKAKMKTKPIAKRSERKRVNKKQLLGKQKNKKVIIQENEYLDRVSKQVISKKLRQQREYRIILLLPCNKESNTERILESIRECMKRMGVRVIQCNGMGYRSIRIQEWRESRMQIISPQSNIEVLIQLMKCADIICPVLSCKSTNVSGMSIDPFEGKAFDEGGYSIINTLCALQLPTIIGIIQDIEIHNNKYWDRIQKLFHRFIESQITKCKIITLKNQNSIMNLIRIYKTINCIKQNWKINKSYMLIDKIQNYNNNTIITGYLKGNCINANQIVHITGFQDYQIDNIQIHSQNQLINLSQYATHHQSIYPFAKYKNQTDQDITTAIAGLKLQQQNAEQVQSMKEEIEQDEDQNISDQQLEQVLFGNKQQQKTKRIEMHYRKEDQLQFEDEVQYAAQEILRDKYSQYQGLKNFKNSLWNPIQNLPEDYDRIYTFKHHSKTYQSALTHNQDRGFAYPGFYLSITISNFKNKENLGSIPLLAVFLLNHERKMTMLHCKVSRNRRYDGGSTEIISNKTYMLHLGFRRMEIKPIFSRVISGTEKTKFTKKIKEDYQNHYYCSFYGLNMFSKVPCLLYEINPFNKRIQPCALMIGNLLKCDPLQIILQRIILTGYPHKINKRRSTIKYMFFNARDVKFFRPIQLRTKMGLRGKIQASLGTHGLMKCFFSDKIKHNDTVFMTLYKRVYPLPYFQHND